MADIDAPVRGAKSAFQEFNVSFTTKSGMHTHATIPMLGLAGEATDLQLATHQGHLLQDSPTYRASPHREGTAQ